MSAGCRICRANGDSWHCWPGLKAIGKIEAIRERKGKKEQSVRYLIKSAEITPERLLEFTRNHSKIENCLHWVPDVVMDEDRMRNRTLSGPECLAALRRIALNIVRLKDDKNTLKGRMQSAAMSDEYLIDLSVNAVGKFQERWSGRPFRPHLEMPQRRMNSTKKEKGHPPWRILA